VLVIEHNLDVIQCADWVIDLGPEAGAGGGQRVACGTPEEVAACAASHTGRFLREILASADTSAPTKPPSGEVAGRRKRGRGEAVSITQSLSENS
jgi:excinuclease ABC subunit A